MMKPKQMKFPAKLMRRYHLAVYRHDFPVVIFRDTQDDTPPNAVRIEYSPDWLNYPESPEAVAASAREQIDTIRSLPNLIARMEGKETVWTHAGNTAEKVATTIAELKKRYAEGVQPVLRENVTTIPDEKLPS